LKKIKTQKTSIEIPISLKERVETISKLANLPTTFFIEEFIGRCIDGEELKFGINLKEIN
jgi:predicted DNA-binding protein